MQALREESHNLSRVDPDWIERASGGENVVPEAKCLGYTDTVRLSQGKKRTRSWGAAQLLEAFSSMRKAQSPISAPYKLWSDRQ